MSWIDIEAATPLCDGTGEHDWRVVRQDGDDWCLSACSRCGCGYHMDASGIYREWYVPNEFLDAGVPDASAVAATLRAAALTLDLFAPEHASLATRMLAAIDSLRGGQS